MSVAVGVALALALGVIAAAMLRLSNYTARNTHAIERIEQWLAGEIERNNWIPPAGGGEDWEASEDVKGQVRPF